MLHACVCNRSISIVTGYGMDNPGSIPGMDRDFSLRHYIHTGSKSHAADTEGYFLVG